MSLSSRFVLVSFLLVLAAGCSLFGFELIAGSGVGVVEEREVPTFQDVRLSGALDVVIQPGDVCGVMVEGDDNLVPLIITEVEGDRLRVRSQPKINMRPKLPLQVTVICPTLHSVHVSGACELVVPDLNEESFEMVVSGASEVSVSGTCGVLTLEASGASEADLASLTAATAEIEISGASDVQVYATDSIRGTASGASSIEYSGTSEVQIETSGASSAKAVER